MISVALAAAGVVGVVTTATAADVTASVVGTITLQNLTETDQNRVDDWIQATIPIQSPGPVTAGDTFTIGFPSELSANGFTHQPMSDSNGNVLAYCDMPAGAGPVLACAFTQYAATLSSVTGQIRAATQATSTTTSTTVSFQVGSTTTLVDLPGGNPVTPAPSGGGGGGTTEVPTSDRKDAWQQMPDNVIGFHIQIVASTLTAGGTISVVDHLPTGLYLEIGSATYADPTLEYWSSGTNFTTEQPAGTSDGSFQNGDALPGGGTLSVTSTNGATSLNATFPNFDPGNDGVYWLNFFCAVQGLASQQVINTATINDTSVSGTVNYVNQFSGTLWGPGYGGVTITKIVDGAGAADVPNGLAFTVTGTPDSGAVQTLVLQPGAVNARSMTFPAGTQVTVTETPPADTSTYTWLPPQFTSSSPNVQVAADGRSAVVTIPDAVGVDLTITNTAQAGSMNLVLAKSLLGSGPWHPGDSASFTLTPSNDGSTQAAAGWSVTDVVPAGLTLTAMSGTGYTCDVSTATCTAGAALAAGGTGESITVTASIDAGATGVLHNVAYVSPAAGDIAETNPLAVPSTSTDTSTTSTDNDAQADLTVSAVRGSVRVGDLVWSDANHNGIQDVGEPGIGGVTLTLTGPDGNPVTDVNGLAVPPTTTDASGKYEFSNLPILAAGQHYTVTVTDPSGYAATVPQSAGSTTADDSSTGSATSGDLTSDGAADLSLDFGYWVPGPGVSIVKNDIRGNSGDDPADPVKLVNGTSSIGVVMTVTNTGQEPLTDLTVTDRVTAGSATLTGLTCDFSTVGGPASGTSWAGPVAVGDSFTCTGAVTGLVTDSEHTDIATVRATGQFSGAPVTDANPYSVVELPAVAAAGAVVDTGAPVGQNHPSLLLAGVLLLLLAAVGAGAWGRQRREHAGLE